MDTTQLLISGYLDGELSDDEAARLVDGLSSDGASLEKLVWNSFIHWQLLEWMDHQSVQDRGSQGHEMAVACGAGGEVPASQRGAATGGANGSNKNSRSHQRRGKTSRTRARIRSVAAVAAALLVAAGISAVTYIITSRPVMVAQLTDAAGCRWAGTQAQIPVGTFLRDGQELQLVRGNAVVTFESGAKMWLEGPTSLRLDSSMEAHLLSGRIAAKVPIQARGFAVNTSLARFIDLGTSFTLSLAAERSFELHVFEGLVELQLDERFGEAARRPVQVTEVRAYSFDVESGDVAIMHFEEGKDMPF